MLQYLNTHDWPEWLVVIILVLWFGTRAFLRDYIRYLHWYYNASPMDRPGVGPFMGYIASKFLG